MPDPMTANPETARLLAASLVIEAARALLKWTQDIEDGERSVGSIHWPRQELSDALAQYDAIRDR